MNLATIKEITTKVGSGATPRGGESVYRASGVSLIRSQNVLDNAMTLENLAHIDDIAAASLSSVAVETGDILLNITGESVARCCLVDESALPARVNQHVMIIRTNELADPRYVQKWFVNPSTKSDLLAMSSGGTRRALTKAQIEKFMVPLPPLAAQRAIADVLGALDEKIAADDRELGALTSLAVTVIQKTSSRVALSELARHNQRSISPESLGATEVAHFSLPAFDEGGGATIDRASNIKSNKFLLSGPSVLVSKLNPRFPRIWNVPGLSGASVTSTEFVVLEPTGVTTSELWASLMQPDFSTYLCERVAGTSGSHQQVKPIEILQARVRDPRTLSVSDCDLLTSLGLRAAQLTEESTTLATLRDALLPELMSGRLRVKDAEKTVEEVL